MSKELQTLIVRPILTESTLASIHSMNRYAFEVLPSANKSEIRKAIEEHFQVHVTQVRTANRKGKAVVSRAGRRRIAGNKKNWKKAWVQLAQGESLPFIEE